MKTSRMDPPSTRSTISVSVPSARHDRTAARGAPRLHAWVLDARLRQGLVALRALGRAGLHVGVAESATRIPAFRSRWCGVSASVPDVSDDADAWIRGLLALLAQYPARALIPSHDGSIEALRAHRREVERFATIALASESALEIAVDKARTLAVATQLGIPVPRGIEVSDVSDVPAATREVGFPAVVKPLQSWVERDGVATRLACEAVVNVDEAKRAVATMLEAGGQAILQQWLPGSREAVSLFYAQGRVWARFMQVAHRMYPPLGGSSVLRESIPLHADATDAAESLVRAIELEGYSEIEFRRDQAGRPALMEINPRLSASVEIAVRSGVNFPLLLYSWAAGERLGEVSGYRLGYRMRWLGGDLYHLRDAYRLRGQGRPDIPPLGRAMGAFLTDFLRPTGYDYLDVRDVAPAVVATRDMLGHLATRGVRRLRA
jgi:predicted ATP-grasp superfamily ATP-dependent carboligase